MNQIETMRKLYALSINEGATQHERQTARQLLQARMDANGLTLEDILQKDKTSRVFFPYKTKHEENILFHIISRVLDLPMGSIRYYGQGKRWVLGADVTKAEEVDIRVMADHYLNLFREEVKLLYVAFVNKHDLFGPTDPNDKRPTDHRTQEERDRLMRLITGLQDSDDPRGRQLMSGLHLGDGQ